MGKNYTKNIHKNKYARIVRVVDTDVHLVHTKL